MKEEFITIAVVALIAAHALANLDRTPRGFTKGGYIDEDGDFEDKSNERDASISTESGGCRGSVDSNSREVAYENDGHYTRKNHRDGYSSAKASAAASADASAKAYEHRHKDSILI